MVVVLADGGDEGGEAGGDLAAAGVEAVVGGGELAQTSDVSAIATGSTRGRSANISADSGNGTGVVIDGSLNGHTGSGVTGRQDLPVPAARPRTVVGYEQMFECLTG